MASEHAHVIAWQPDVKEEPIDFVYEDGGSPARGVVIGLAFSVALWSALGGGLWIGLTLVGVSS